MIRFHYHHFPVERRFGPMPVPAGTLACHVYSTEGLEELIEWARAHSVPRHWMHRSRGGFSHLDLWGSALQECGEGVSDRQMAEDARAWTTAPAQASAR